MIHRIIILVLTLMFTQNSFGDLLQGYVIDKDAYGCYEKDLKRCFRIPVGMPIDLEGVDLSYKVAKMEGFNVTEEFEGDWWIESKFISNSSGFKEVDVSKFLIKNMIYDSAEWRYKLRVEDGKIFFGYGSEKEIKVKAYTNKDLYGVVSPSLEGDSLFLVYGDTGSCLRELVCVPNELCKIEVAEEETLCPNINIYNEGKVEVDPNIEKRLQHN